MFYHHFSFFKFLQAFICWLILPFKCLTDYSWLTWHSLSVSAGLVALNGSNNFSGIVPFFGYLSGFFIQTVREIHLLNECSHFPSRIKNLKVLNDLSALPLTLSVCAYVLYCLVSQNVTELFIFDFVIYYMFYMVFLSNKQ